MPQQLFDESGPNQLSMIMKYALQSHRDSLEENLYINHVAFLDAIAASFSKKKINILSNFVRDNFEHGEQVAAPDSALRSLGLDEVRQTDAFDPSELEDIEDG